MKAAFLIVASTIFLLYSIWTKQKLKEIST
jgi:hypothetical protein